MDFSIVCCQKTRWNIFALKDWLNPGPLGTGGKRERYPCAMPTPNLVDFTLTDQTFNNKTYMRTQLRQGLAKPGYLELHSLGTYQGAKLP